jgi:putative transposase
MDRRRAVDAIFFVAARGCQWRALPAEYPNWNTVHRYHLEWSRNGTWERIAERLARAVREAEGRDPDASGSIIDSTAEPVEVVGADGVRVEGRERAEAIEAAQSHKWPSWDYGPSQVTPVRGG